MPDALSRVTEYVPQIVSFVSDIVDKGTPAKAMP